MSVRHCSSAYIYVSCIRPRNSSSIHSLEPITLLWLYMYLVSVQRRNTHNTYSSGYICILSPAQKLLQPLIQMYLLSVLQNLLQDRLFAYQSSVCIYIVFAKVTTHIQLWLHMYLVSVLGTYHSSSYSCFFFLCPQNLHSQLHMVTHVTYPSLKTVKVFGQNCLNDEISSQNFYHNVPDK